MRKLFLVLLAVACTLVAASASAAEVETIALFDPAAFETPESIQIDHHGNIYSSFFLTGEIRKITQDGIQSTFAFLPVHQELQPCPNVVGVGAVAGIALDLQDNVYVSVISCNTADLGIWKVTPHGHQSLVAHLPALAFDDFAFDVQGNLYGTTDPFNTVLRVAPNGTVETLLTFADGLDGPSSAAFGVKNDKKSLYVANAAFPFFLGQTPRRPSVM